MKLKSIFGTYAEAMQLMIDNRNDRFDPLWFPQYFTVGTPTLSLDFSTVIGQSRIEAVASVVDRDSETPLRSRPDLKKLTGSIPSIREMFFMKESDLREMMMMENMPLPDATKKAQILNYIWNDTRKAGNSVYKRIDMMCLEAVSTGKITLNLVNNPDGVVSDDIDLLMSADNKKTATASWGDSANAKPITDINNVVSDARKKGISFSKILMTPTLFEKFRVAKEVIDTLTGFYYAAKPGGSFNPVGISTIDSVNQYLNANRMPVIEIVDQVFGVEKDGKIQTVQPFSDNNAAFIPSGSLGEIKNAIAMEEMRKVENVSYAKFNNALISKWHQNEPLREWTKAEWNAFPAFDAIDYSYILTAVYS